MHGESRGNTGYLGLSFILGTDNHKVTGAELNGLTSQIQKHLIDINTIHGKFIKEFGQVYNALEALDKDYIQAILISIKATEATSQGIADTQKEIKQIVDGQRKTLEVLKKFKEKLDSYAHLGDIDKLWSNFNKWNNEMEEHKRCLEQQISQTEFVLAFACELNKTVHLHDIDEMWESLEHANNLLTKICSDLNSIRGAATKQQSDIEILLKFKDTVSGYEHLQDINEIWSKTEVHSDKLDGLVQQSANALELVRASQGHIDELSKYKEDLCDITHLKDVDALWDSNKVHLNQLSKLEKQSEETNNLIQNNKEIIDASIADSIEKNNAVMQELTQKVKYAYLVAGGTLGLALIELVVMLLKVM